MVPIEILNTAVCVAIGRGHYSSQDTDDSDTSQNGSVSDSPSAGGHFSAILTAFTGSATLSLLLYVALLVTLTIYTMRRRRGPGSRTSDVWFEVINRTSCPFIIPPMLRAFFVSNYVEGMSVSPFTTALPGHPSLNDFSQPGDTVVHHCVSDCSCRDKPLPRPSRPEEYREIQRICQQARRESTMKKDEDTSRWTFRNVLRGRNRASSAPILPAIRIPTERDRRRSLFTIAFEVV